MKRRNRLSQTNDILRVRRYGTSYAHPLIVLMKCKNNLKQVRMGVMVNKSIGGAVVRNRCKRQIRSLFDGYLDRIENGWDLLIIARQPIGRADYSSMKSTLQDLLCKAELMNP